MQVINEPRVHIIGTAPPQFLYNECQQVGGDPYLLLKGTGEDRCPSMALLKKVRGVWTVIAVRRTVNLSCHIGVDGRTSCPARTPSPVGLRPIHTSKTPFHHPPAVVGGRVRRHLLLKTHPT